MRLICLGVTHIVGDAVASVETDRLLFAGDIVMNPRSLAFASPYASIKTSLTDFEPLEGFKPIRIVSSHGQMGDGSLFVEQSTTAIQVRAVALKRDWKSAEEAAPDHPGGIQDKVSGLDRRRARRQCRQGDL